MLHYPATLAVQRQHTGGPPDLAFEASLTNVVFGLQKGVVLERF